MLGHFPDVSVEEKDIKGKGISKVAELLDKDKGVGKKADMRDPFESENGEEPPARWSRVDLLVGIVAAVAGDRGSKKRGKRE